MISISYLIHGNLFLYFYNLYLPIYFLLAIAFLNFNLLIWNSNIFSNGKHYSSFLFPTETYTKDFSNLPIKGISFQVKYKIRNFFHSIKESIYFFNSI